MSLFVNINVYLSLCLFMYDDYYIEIDISLTIIGMIKSESVVNSPRVLFSLELVSFSRGALNTNQLPGYLILELFGPMLL